jgi:hypothetical protein
MSSGDNEYMTEREKAQLWVQTWKDAGPELEKIRLREARDQDNLLTLRLLAPAFEHAIRTQPPDDSPGIVEMQRHFAKLRR